MKVNPLCFTNRNFFFVKPDGSYLPCCYSSSNSEVRQHLGEKYEQLSLTNRTFEQVTESEAYQLILEKIKSDNPYGFCNDFCPRHLEARSLGEDDVFWDGTNSVKAI